MIIMIHRMTSKSFIFSAVLHLRLIPIAKEGLLVKVQSIYKPYNQSFFLSLDENHSEIKHSFGNSAENIIAGLTRRFTRLRISKSE